METPFKKQIREHRFIKELAKEEITVKGTRGEATEFVDRIIGEADELLELNEPWVREKLASARDYLGEFTDEEIKQIFFSGLSKNVVQYFRL